MCMYVHLCYVCVCVCVCVSMNAYFIQIKTNQKPDDYFLYFVSSFPPFEKEEKEREREGRGPKGLGLGSTSSALSRLRL
jgi:hypothetical protein